MKTPLTYGFIMALGGALLSLLMFFSGLQDSVEKMPTAQWIGGIGGAGIGVACLVLAMREKRAGVPADGDWGYGSALGVGVLTGLFGSLFGTVFAYVYFTYLNPNMSELILQMQVAKMEEQGLSATQIANAEPMMRKMMTPVMLTVFQTFFGFLWSVVLALIVAIFLRKKLEVAAAVEGGEPPVVG